MQYLFPFGIKLLRENAPNILKPEFFEDREAKAMGCTVTCVKPVLKFPGGKVKLYFQVAVRRNGTDAAKWPENLLTDVVV